MSATVTTPNAASPTAVKMTADEFFEFSARHGRCELIRGEVIDLVPPGEQHGGLAMDLAYRVMHFVLQHRLGKVYAAETGFRLDDEGRPTVRAPDLAYLRADRVVSTKKYAAVAPDLVAEVVSPTDTAHEVIEKAQWWLKHQVKLVWVVDPDTATVTAYRPDGSARVYQRADTLPGEDVLPGFALPLVELFTGQG